MRALTAALVGLIFGGATYLTMSEKYDSVNRGWVEQSADWLPRLEPFDLVGWRNEQGDVRVIYDAEADNSEDDGGLVLKSDTGFDTDNIQ